MQIATFRQNLKLLINAALSTLTVNTFNLIENRLVINYVLPLSWYQLK